MNFKPLINATTFFCKRHGSEILTGISAIATVAAVVKCAKDTRHYDTSKIERKNEIVTKIDSAIVFAESYWATILLTATAIAAGAGSTVIDKKKQASLLIAYNVLQNKFNNYKNVLADTNPDAYQSQQDTLIKASYDEYTKNIDEGPAEDLFYDDRSGILFECSDKHVREVFNTMDRILMTNGWVSLYTYYNELGLLDLLSKEQKEESKCLGWFTFVYGLEHITKDDESTDCIYPSMVYTSIDNNKCCILSFMNAPTLLDEGRIQIIKEETKFEPIPF